MRAPDDRDDEERIQITSQKYRDLESGESFDLNLSDEVWWNGKWIKVISPKWDEFKVYVTKGMHYRRPITDNQEEAK